MANIIFYAQFKRLQVGVTGLTVTVDLDKVERATGTRTVVSTAASAVEDRDGLYQFSLASPDLTTYDYIAVFKTADVSVDDQQIPSIWTSYLHAISESLYGTFSDIIFYSQYKKLQLGATGLTVTVDVDRITLSDGSRTVVSTGVAATEGRDGWYYYRVAAADLLLYDYAVVFKTADVTVDDREIPALWTNYGAGLGSDLAAILAYVNYRLANPAVYPGESVRNVEVQSFQDYGS